MAASLSLTTVFKGSENTRFTENSFTSTPKSLKTNVAIAQLGRTKAKIILVKDVEHLGKVGDLVEVRRGYFRNFLFPQQLAKIATPGILKAIRLEQEKKEAAIRKIKEDAERIARQFQTIGMFSVRRKVGKGKTIFGTVTAQDVADIIKAQTSKELDKRDISLPDIGETGVFDAVVKLHPEVSVVVKVNVVGK